MIFIAENEPQEVKLVRSPEQGGYGLDGLWNDDFHHTAMVALTGRNEAYYTDYLGTPQEFISSMKYGYLYQGQRYKWQKKRRGTPGLDINPAAFVTFIQNHDQIANSAYGQRCHALTSPGKLRAITALMLLGARHAHAVSRPGIRRLQPVPFFRRSRRRTQPANPPGPRRVSRAIPQPGYSRNAGSVLPIPAIPLPSNAASWTIPSARRIARSTICIAIC